MRPLVAGAGILFRETLAARRFFSLMAEKRGGLAADVIDRKFDFATTDPVEKVSASMMEFAKGLECRLIALSADAFAAGKVKEIVDDADLRRVFIENVKARQKVVERYYEAALVAEQEILLGKYKQRSSCCDGKVELFMAESTAEKAALTMIVAAVDGVQAGRMVVAHAKEHDHLTIFQAHSPLLEAGGINMSEMLANMVLFFCKEKVSDSSRRMQVSCVGIYNRELDALTDGSPQQREMLFAPTYDKEGKLASYELRAGFPVSILEDLALSRVRDAMEKKDAKPAVSASGAGAKKLSHESEHHKLA